MPYTDEQKAAINALDGNTRVFSCAGSGKTEVVARRIAALIHNGVKPENIVCFTFTNKAAEEMKSRIHKHVNNLCPDSLLGPLFVGTIHSFCFKLLKEHNIRFNSFSVLTENSRIAFLANPDNYHSIGLDIPDGYPSKFRKIARFCESVDVFREELIDMERLKSKAKTKEEKLFPFRYKKYSDLLDSKRFIDFSGILFECYNMLKEKSVLEQIKNQYTHLVCDEYQDINKIQEEIIKRIWGDSQNICVVGDDDQSIYHWRGTKPEYLINFENRYPKVTTFRMQKNFRTAKRIASIANKIISHNNRVKKQMLSDKLDEPDNVIIGEFENDIHEARFIVRKIKEMIGKDFVLPNNQIRKLSYGDFAILFRSVKNSSKAVINELTKEEIPFRVTGGTSDLFECKEVDFIAKCFAYLSDLEYRGNSYSLIELSRELEDIVLRKDIRDRFKSKTKKIKRDLFSSKRLDLQRTYHKVLEAIGVQEGIFSDSVLRLFGHFSELIKDFEDINYPMSHKDFKFFLGYIEGYAIDEYNPEVQWLSEDIDVVTISTVHRAKGLQFGFVFIPSLNKKLFPTPNRMNHLMLNKDCFPFDSYRGSIEDERRLFYVAITRAIAYISASWVKARNDRAMDPSKFFEEFRQAMKSTKPLPRGREKFLRDTSSDDTRFVFSPTTVNSYITCPYSYKLRYLCQFNPGVDPAIGYGKQIHLMMEYLFKTSTRRIPDKSLVERIVDDNFFLRFAYGKVFGNLKRKALKLICDYVENYGEDFEKYLYSEKEFFMRLKDFEYRGVVDLLLDAKGNEVEIVDFKTRIGPLKDFQTQMNSYATGIESSYGYRVKSAFVHFLTTNKRSKVTISLTSLKRVRKTVKQVADKVRSMEFPYANDKKLCKTCDFKIFCPGALDAKVRK